MNYERRERYSQYATRIPESTRSRHIRLARLVYVEEDSDTWKRRVIRSRVTTCVVRLQHSKDVFVMQQDRKKITRPDAHSLCC